MKFNKYNLSVRMRTLISFTLLFGFSCDSISQFRRQSKVSAPINANCLKSALSNVAGLSIKKEIKNNKDSEYGFLYEFEYLTASIGMQKNYIVHEHTSGLNQVIYCGTVEKALNVQYKIEEQLKLLCGDVSFVPENSECTCYRKNTKIQCPL